MPDTGASHEGHAQAQLFSYSLQNLPHTLLSCKGQAPQNWSAQQYRICSQAQCLQTPGSGLSELNGSAQAGTVDRLIQSVVVRELAYSYKRTQYEAAVSVHPNNHAFVLKCVPGSPPGRQNTLNLRIYCAEQANAPSMMSQGRGKCPIHEHRHMFTNIRCDARQGVPSGRKYQV